MARKRDKTQYAVDARRNIRAAFDSLPIFRRERGQALYHYCAALEVEAFRAEGDLTKTFSAHRKAVESSGRAIPALFERCSPGHTAIHLDRAIFAEADELFRFSRDYDQVESSFELAEKGQWAIHVANREPRITFAYTATSADRADTLLRSAELAEHMGSNRPSATDTTAMQSTIARVRTALAGTIRRVGEDRIAYEHSADLIASASEWARLPQAATAWHMDPDLRCGAPSFADVRRFWGAALAMADVHDLAHLVACRGDLHQWPVGSRVQLLAKEEWGWLLSIISGVSQEIVSILFEWFTFNPRIAAKTPLLQPFLEINPGMMCAPSLFLIGNDFERNFLKLLMRHPALRQYADTVKASKEPRALADIAGQFPEPTYRTKPQIVLPMTDADLVIYEQASGWAIIVQHKWLIAPETLNESASNDVELGKGIRQAIQARDHFRANNMDALRDALSLSPSEPLVAIEVCVICRGSGPTGFAAQLEVPVLTEKAFLSLLERDRMLPNLWALLNARPDLTEAAQRFREAQAPLVLAGIEFVLPVLAR